MCGSNCSHFRGCAMEGTGYNCDLNNGNPQYFCIPCKNYYMDNMEELTLDIPAVKKESCYHLNGSVDYPETNPKEFCKVCICRIVAQEEVTEDLPVVKSEEKKLQCDYCGGWGIDVRQQCDPYAKEIHNDYTEHLICEGCFIESCKEI